MRKVLLPLFACAVMAAQSPAADAKASAELKVGTAIEKMEIEGESTTFKVAAGTRLYAWARVTGVSEGAVTVVFSMGERASKVELKVPRSPYRTNAFRTFRAGDSGAWTVKVLGADGAELGQAGFTVEVE